MKGTFISWDEKLMVYLYSYLKCSYVWVTEIELYSLVEVSLSEFSLG